MKILLLGRTGQVGFELQRTLAPLGDVLAPDRGELDLMDVGAVENYLTDASPSLIVNAAAWTAVDAAEDQQSEAERLNTALPAQLAEYASSNGIRLIHFSSDYVYPGSGEAPWKETSPIGPLSFYGKSKLEGDLLVEDSGADYLIFRTSWVYSARGNNFMKTMLRLAQSKTELGVVSDQIGAPTPARLIAQVATLAVYGKLEKGLYHLATKGETSWCEFAEHIFSLSSHNAISVNPIPTAEYITPAKRPLNSRLDVNKLEIALGIRLPSWQDQLKQTLGEYLNADF